MIPDEVPEGRCGFVLSSEEASKLDWYEDVEQWFRVKEVVCCWRETWNETGRCIWHAKRDEKRLSELVDNRTPKEERLDGVYLAGVHANNSLSFGGCSLRRGDLTKGEFHRVNFQNADLENADVESANLPIANFEDAKIEHGDLRDTNLRGTDFRDANLRDADLRDANIRDSDLGDVNLIGADLRNARLRNADLDDAALYGADFRDANLENTDLSSADLRNAKFGGGNLQTADLQDTDLRNADVVDADLCRTILSEANIEDADLQDTNFRDSDLEGANLGNADIRGADLEDASLVRTDLREANLSNARLYQTYFSDVRINSDTEFGDTCIYETPDELDDDWDEKWDATPTEAAVWTYRRLQDLHEKYALTERARHYHIKKEEAEKKRHREEGNWKEWAIYAINGTLSEHGERPWRVVRISLYVIFLWSSLYLLSGIRIPDGFSGTRTVGLELFSEVPVPTPLGGTLVSGLDQLATSIYFSVVTFTTLGYGDLQPATGFAQALATVESFLGALLMAYLVFVLGRRTNW